MRQRQFITKVATAMVPLVISTSAIAAAVVNSSSASAATVSTHSAAQGNLADQAIRNNMHARLAQQVARLMEQGQPAIAMAPAVALEMAQPKVLNDGMFACIRVAESSNRWNITSGAYGILVSSWWAYQWVWAPYGNYGVPGDAPASVQNLVAYELFLAGGQGYGGWYDYCTGR
jgi:hypothetical protein